ncbi:MAG: metallophosphoesterase [Planctomycetaceae bacterium]
MQLPTKIDGPVAVIGDVHGQVDKLQTILTKLQGRPDFRQRWIVFMGDFVDRGPNPSAATELVLSLMQSHGNVAAVCGNHELAMCGALHLFPPPDYAEWDQRWVGHYDSHTTFESYGAEFGDMPALLEAIPEHHRNFYANLPWCIEHPQYLFVHAGLESHQPYDMQVGILHARDYTLTRPPWLCSKTLVTSPVPADSPVTIVSGHVRMPEVTFGDRRLLVDTTGGTEGDLSCVLLPENIIISSGSDAARAPLRTTTAPAARSQTFGSPAGEVEQKAWWKIW